VEVDPASSRTAHEIDVWKPQFKWPKNSGGVTEVSYYFSDNINTEELKNYFRQTFTSFEGNITNLAFKEVRKDNDPRAHQLEVKISCSHDLKRRCSYGGGGVVNTETTRACGRQECEYYGKISLKMYGEPYSYDRSGRKYLQPVWFSVLRHEVFHVFGITHTQKRSDRDQYVDVLMKNVRAKKKSQYHMCETCTLPEDVPYECNSIMHYKNGDFGIKPCRRCQPLDTLQAKNKATCPSFGNDYPTKNDWKSLQAKVDSGN